MHSLLFKLMFIPSSDLSPLISIPWVKSRNRSVLLMIFPGLSFLYQELKWSIAKKRNKNFMQSPDQRFLTILSKLPGKDSAMVNDRIKTTFHARKVGLSWQKGKFNTQIRSIPSYFVECAEQYQQ